MEMETAKRMERRTTITTISSNGTTSKTLSRVTSSGTANIILTSSSMTCSNGRTVEVQMDCNNNGIPVKLQDKETAGVSSSKTDNKEETTISINSLRVRRDLIVGILVRPQDKETAGDHKVDNKEASRKMDNKEVSRYLDGDKAAKAQ